MADFQAISTDTDTTIAINEEFSVHCWHVGVDRVVSDGRLVIGDPLTPYFNSRDKAANVLQKLRIEYPGAAIRHQEYFFNPLRAGDLQDRDEMLNKLV